MKKCIFMFMMFIFSRAHAMEKENTSNAIAWETHEVLIKRTSQHFNRTLYYCNKKSFDKTKRVMLEYQDEDKVWPLSLTVFDIENKKEPRIIFNILFPLSYRFTAINFNKQGTHLLVRFFQPDHKGKEHKKRMLFALNYTDLCLNK